MASELEGTGRNQLSRIVIANIYGRVINGIQARLSVITGI